jgi:hypothetical protein
VAGCGFPGCRLRISRLQAADFPAAGCGFQAAGCTRQLSKHAEIRCLQNLNPFFSLQLDVRYCVSHKLPKKSISDRSEAYINSYLIMKPVEEQPTANDFCRSPSASFPQSSDTECRPVQRLPQSETSQSGRRQNVLPNMPQQRPPPRQQPSDSALR